jgi:transcriptional regulator with XRE-family HTH domain
MPPSRKPNDALRRAREERGWTQSDAASALGFSLEAVQSWERGRRIPRPKQQAKLCEVYQRTLEQLDLGPQPSGKIEPLPAQDTRALVPGAPFAQKDSSEISLLYAGVNLDWERPPLFRQITDKVRRRMLMNVWSICIDGKLRHLLGHTALIALNLMEWSEAPDCSSHFVVQENDQPRRDLPTGTSILDVYDDADGELLILGEPGAGKTVLLLELTHTLLMRAVQDESTSLPVVFNLTSWTEEQPSLDEWLVAELQTTYHIPEKVGRTLVEANQLALLLDSLDEITEETRPACVKAIRAYQQEHPLASLVLCCRREPYGAQATPLVFQQTILVQPLTEEQIDLYLSSAHCQREAVKRAFQEDLELQQMCTNPLMLNIITRIYQDEDHAALALDGSLEMRRQQVFDWYTQQMLTRSKTETASSPEQTKQWLRWLAKQLKDHNQVEFYLERMQPDWLPDSHARQCYRKTVVRLVFGIQILISAVLFAWLRGGKQGELVGVGLGLLGQLGAGPGNSVLGWMAPGLGGGLEGGGSLGILFALGSVLVPLLVDQGEPPALTAKALWRGLVSGMRAGFVTGVIVGIFSGCVFSLSGGLASGWYRGLGAGLFSGLLMGLMIGLLASLRQLPERERSPRLHHKEIPLHKTGPITSLFDTLLFGLVAFLGNAGVYALLLGHLNRDVIVYASIIGLFYGVAFGFGGGTNLIRELGTVIRPAETISWSWRAVGQTFLSNLAKGGMIGLFVMGCGSVILGCASGLFYGAAYGLRYGLIYGLILGLVSALASMLTGMLRSGWSSQVLEEQQLRHPNEGVRRSLKHAVFAACLFGPLGGLASGLMCGGAFGLIGRLPGWPILGAGFALIFGILFALHFVTLEGGIACLQHYLLRWYLWRAGCMPWRYTAFLDKAAERVFLHKIGGGYMFIHRLLLDYFVGIEDTASPERSD